MTKSGYAVDPIQGEARDKTEQSGPYFFTCILSSSCYGGMSVNIEGGCNM